MTHQVSPLPLSNGISIKYHPFPLLRNAISIESIQGDQLSTTLSEMLYLYRVSKMTHQVSPLPLNNGISIKYHPLPLLRNDIFIESIQGDQLSTTLLEMLYQ